MRTNGVNCLLMGGQACVFYGAAEFSRDTDLAILADSENLDRLRAALDDLGAENIAVPPLHLDFLQRGHAIHFRCKHREAIGMRIDVMSRMRGVDSFELLWERRSTIEQAGSGTVDLLSLPDLVKAKKTQRDKDWPMIRRLVEAHFFAHRSEPTDARVRFWLRELRTPTLLSEVCSSHETVADEIATERPLVRQCIEGDATAVSRELDAEEARERAADAEHWKPLKEELQQLRRDRLK